MPPYGALLVSMGGAGGIWVNAQAAYLARVPEKPIISTVGSGDAALAGALRAMQLGLPAEDALRLAMACGVANAMRGEVGSIRMADVQAVYKEIDVSRI